MDKTWIIKDYSMIVETHKTVSIQYASNVNLNEVCATG